MNYVTRYAQFVIAIFSPHMWVFHGMAILLTFILVMTGADWNYLVFVLHTMPQALLFIADGIGFLIPVILLITSVFTLLVGKNIRRRIYAEAMVYALVLGFSLSTVVKVFSGRTSPPHLHQGLMPALVDNSHAFHFGFFREQVIGGWPSSHATIAFALAVTLIYLLPKRWYLRAALLLSAFCVGIGVTFGFHWLSEFVAGALLGSVIGNVVGKYYSQM